MTEYNPKQLKIIEAIASWKRPSKLCGRDQCTQTCHILDGLAKGDTRQQTDLLLPGIQNFAASCSLHGYFDGVDIDIFDMLEQLHEAAS